MNPARRAPHRPAQLTHEYSLFAPGDITAPRVCRDFVRAVLFTHDQEPLVMPAALCTSELVTNVHLHTKGSTMVRLRLAPARLRVSVFDESPDPPVVTYPAAGVVACWGRGSLSSRRWRMRGVSPTSGRGGMRRGCGSSWAGRRVLGPTPSGDPPLKTATASASVANTPAPASPSTSSSMTTKIKAPLPSSPSPGPTRRTGSESTASPTTPTSPSPKAPPRAS
jgi:cell division septation protein DedD